MTPQTIAGRYGIELADTNGVPQREFEVGDGLVLPAHGLKANFSHQISVQDDKSQSIFAISLVSDRFGSIRPSGGLPSAPAPR